MSSRKTARKSRPGYAKAAFKSGANKALLPFLVILFAVLSFVFTPLALVGIPAAELLFVAIKSLSPEFRAKVDAEERARLNAARATAVQKELATLSPNQRAAYQELRDLTDKTLACYGRLPSGGMLLASSESQMNGMLDLFLKLMGALNGYRRYMSSTDRGQIEKELAILRTEMASVPVDQMETPVNRIKARRISMMEERLARFDKAREGRELVSHQLASIDDFLRLFHEQALTLRDPEMATMQIENLTQQLEAGDDAMRDLMNFSAVSEEFALLDPTQSVSMDMQQVR